MQVSYMHIHSILMFIVRVNLSWLVVLLTFLLHLLLNPKLSK